jgi:hypothetical protein
MPDDDEFNTAFPFRLGIGAVFLTFWVGYSFFAPENPHLPSAYWMTPVSGFFFLPSIFSFSAWPAILFPWLVFWMGVVLSVLLPSRVILRVFRR